MSQYKEQLFSKFQLSDEPIKKEIAGMEIFVKRLSAAQIEDYQFARMGEEVDIGGGDAPRRIRTSQLRGWQFELIALCLSDSEGTLLFDSADEVGQRFPKEFCEAAAKLCREVNDMDETVEEAEGNS